MEIEWNNRLVNQFSLTADADPDNWPGITTSVENIQWEDEGAYDWTEESVVGNAVFSNMDDFCVAIHAAIGGQLASVPFVKLYNFLETTVIELVNDSDRT